MLLADLLSIWYFSEDEMFLPREECFPTFENPVLQFRRRVDKLISQLLGAVDNYADFGKELGLTHRL